MTRTELMDTALAIVEEWKVIKGERPEQKVDWETDPASPAITHGPGSPNYMKSVPDEFKSNVCSLMTTISEDYKPSTEVASTQLRHLFNPPKDDGGKGGMRDCDWKTCDDMTFGVYVVRYLTMISNVPICSTDPLILKGWLAFKDTFQHVINDATRTEIESAEYHKGKANLKEWREDGCP